MRVQCCCTVNFQTYEKMQANYVYSFMTSQVQWYYRTILKVINQNCANYYNVHYFSLHTLEHPIEYYESFEFTMK